MWTESIVRNQGSLERASNVLIGFEHAAMAVFITIPRKDDVVSYPVKANMVALPGFQT